MSERNENEWNANEVIENELNVKDEVAATSALAAAEAAPQIAPVIPEAPTKNSAAIILPWVVAVIAIVALVIVLFNNNSKDGFNKTVGTMDGATFTAADLYEEMTLQGGEEQQASLLDSLMTIKLINLEADKSGAKVSDAEVKAELEKVKEQNGIPSDEALEMALQQSGMTLQGFSEQIATQMKLRLIFEKQSPATEDELKAYFDTNKDHYTTPKQVEASHILLPTKAEAEAVLAELKSGKDFATVAKEKSQDPGSKDNGGELGFFGPGEMNSGFEKAAFALAKGEMSGVVEAESGFHIIKVTDIKEEVVPTYDEVKDDVKQAYYDEKIQNEGLAWMDKVKEDRHYKNLLVKEPEPAASASPEASPEASPAAKE